jgi:hypothetical protein
MLDPTILSEVILLLKRKKLRYQIINHLKSEEVEESKIDAYILAAETAIKKEKLAQHPARNKMFFILFIIIAASIAGYILFQSAPQGETAYLMTAVIAAVFIGICSILAAYFFKSWEPQIIEAKLEGNYADPYLSYKIGIGAAVTIGCIFIFHLAYQHGLTNSIVEHGVESDALIVYGVTHTTADKQQGKLSLLYTDDTGEKYSTEQLVNIQSFNSLLIGDSVPIIYSAKNPNLVHILLDDDIIQLHKHTEQRPLNIKDLLRFHDMTKEEVHMNLIKINYGWEYDGYTATWINRLRGEHLSISRSFVTYGTTYSIIDNLAVELGEIDFKEVTKPEKSTRKLATRVFEKSPFTVKLETYNYSETPSYSVIISTK